MPSYAVYYSNLDKTTAKGFGMVAHLPCIFDSRPAYHRLSSAYLIDRGLGIWHPNLPRTLAPAKPPTARSIDSYAHWLVNFLEWTEKRAVDARTCTYHVDVLGRYQTELEKGFWSRDGQPLANSTVNCYVDTACDYLLWMAHKGKRAPFVIPTTTSVVSVGSAVSARGHRKIEVQTREGKKRKNKTRLKMPLDAAVKKWLAAVYEQRGFVMGLMCETVLLTAMRRSEVAGFRMNTLPLEPENWHISNPTELPINQLVRVSIKYGTKGEGQQSDHGDKVGPSREIMIPLHLAQRLHAYRDRKRPAQVLKWVKGVRGALSQRSRLNGAVHLFRDATGDRVTGRRLYEAWTGVELPFEGWSPHMGRDWWACSTLWRELKVHEEAVRSGHYTPSSAGRTVTDIIRLHIQPQLGHRSDETSLIYLQWAMDMLGVALPQQYIESLEGEEG